MGGTSRELNLSQAKNAMEVYSKAMELDPNSDEAKNGETTFRGPILTLDGRY